MFLLGLLTLSAFTPCFLVSFLFPRCAPCSPLYDSLTTWGWGVARLSDRYLLPSWSTAGMHCWQCSTPSYSIARKVRIGRLLWLGRSLAVVAIVWRRVIMLQIMTLTTFSAALTMVVQLRTPAWLYTAVTGIDSESLEHRIRDESDNSGPPLRGRWNNFSVWQL